ncbi:MAG TPA: hypothetical protein VNL71_13675 [Chloroflexota bacterium]|nr:hypothetical protein [Chloroflexota bacterium]
MITDVTRMRQGRVCIAGYDADLRCVRPVLPPPRILEAALRVGKRGVICPAAEVEFNFGRTVSDPPHTEDIFYSPNSVRLLRRLPEARWHDVLMATMSPTVEALFGQPILSGPGHYVWRGQGERSIGTVVPQFVREVIYRQRDDGTWDYRLGFEDGKGTPYRLAITDLAWRKVCDHLRANGRASQDISHRSADSLRRRTVFLRIGLARGGLDSFPEHCFLQITGIHTFPDYLKGRTFADFSP